MKKSEFGTTPEGKKAHLYFLTNKNGMTAKISNYGGIVAELWVPDKVGKPENVVLGFSNPVDYAEENIRAGAIVGRIAGRLSNAKFSVEGQRYEVTRNEGKHHLHGGLLAMDKKLWKADFLTDEKGTALRLKYLSRDGEEGYPGNVKITATYRLTDNNALLLEFEATTDKTTPLSLTNHAYFNLSGKGSIKDHVVSINADTFAPVDAENIFTGEIKYVQKGVNDFRNPIVMENYLGAAKHHGELYLLDNAGQNKSVAKVYDPALPPILQFKIREHPGFGASRETLSSI